MGALLVLSGIILFLISKYKRLHGAGSSGRARGTRTSSSPLCSPVTYDQDDSPVSYMEDMQYYVHCDDISSSYISPTDIGIGINPASGLPMMGGVDIMGNPYGTDLHSHDSFSSMDWHSHDSFSSLDLHHQDCFSSIDSFSSTDCGFSHFD